MGASGWGVNRRPSPPAPLLVLSLGIYGRAEPLIWQSWTANQKDQDWVGATDALLTVIASAQPPGSDPVRMGGTSSCG